MTDAGDFYESMEESLALSTVALLRSLKRLRNELDRIPKSASLEDPVTLTVCDALLIARRLLTHRR